MKVRYSLDVNFKKDINFKKADLGFSEEMFQNFLNGLKELTSEEYNKVVDKNNEHMFIKKEIPEIVVTKNSK